MEKKTPRNQRFRQRQGEYQNKFQKKVQKKPLIDLYYIIKYFVLWFLFSLTCIGIKAVVMSAISLSSAKEIGNGLIRLYEVHNTGAAFNLFAGHPEILITLSILTVAIITVIVLVASTKLTQAAISAMAFLSTGITMNMLERIHYGYVIDYIQCTFLKGFPVFNIPDLMIVVGAVCLILSILIQRR